MPGANEATIEAWRWLLTEEAALPLAQRDATEATPAQITRLREQLGGGPRGAERAAAVATLAELRRRGVAKFERADAMFFTRKSLEQATDEWVARYKARRFAAFDRVADVCCGVGGDLIGLAKYAGACVGIDADPLLADYTSQNAAVYGFDVSVEARRVEADNLPDVEAWHADPDRRSAGKRTTNPDLHEPSLETLAAWRRVQPNAAVKLAPAASLPESWSDESELEWISRDGECRQQVVWCGALTERPGRRRATAIRRRGDSVESFVGDPGEELAVADELGDWIAEPDPAVLTADLTGAFARDQGLAAVAPGVAYLTTSAQPASPLLASFRVLERMPFRRERLRGWLAERSIGRLEIKVRGMGIDIRSLRGDLKVKGANSTTLLLFPDRRLKTTAIFAERVATAD